MQWSQHKNFGNPTLGQFVTPKWAADILASRVSICPKNALDLGVGKGALTHALLNRFPAVNLVGIDKYATPKIDAVRLQEMGAVLDKKDVFSLNFPKWFLKNHGKVDVVISNPPFIHLDNRPAVQRFLSLAGFKSSPQALKFRSDLYFLASAFRLLNSNGELAFILPSTVFRSKASNDYLQILIYKFGLKEVIFLPSTSFENAEVETAICIFHPKSARQRKGIINLSFADEMHRQQEIGKFQGLDLVNVPTFQTNNVNEQSISSLGGEVTRGRHSSNVLSDFGVTHFHTTSFQKYSDTKIQLKPDAKSHLANDRLASEGDILLARVGTRCIGNSAIIERGQQLISDCVYRLQVPIKNRRRVWEFISSDAGRIWQKSIARGACAKFITRQDLLEKILPL